MIFFRTYSCGGRCSEFWGYFEPFIYNLYIVLGKSVLRHIPFVDEKTVEAKKKHVITQLFIHVKRFGRDQLLRNDIIKTEDKPIKHVEAGGAQG